VNVTVDELFARIGRLSVENELLRAQLADARRAAETADAEVARLRGPCQPPEPPAE